MAVAKLEYEYKTITVDHSTYSGYEVNLADDAGAPEEIIIPDYYNDKPVIIIGSSFDANNNLKRVSIGKNIKYIGNNAFDKCFNLETMYYNAEYASVDQSDDVKRTPFTRCGETSGGFVLTIGKNVRIIPKYMFKPFHYNMDDEAYADIKEITFENGVTTIEEEAFLGFEGTVLLPRSIKEVHPSAFESNVDIIYESEGSIIKVPQNEKADYDFIAFSFDGKHSVEDFGVYRVSNGNRYDMELTPTLKEVTAEVPGADGMYLLGTKRNSKIFNIDIAFDSMNDSKLEEFKKWLNTKEVCDLWFAETPYKVYAAKVTGQPIIKFVCFNDINGNRIYKGEGTIQFTCYWPYAHTPACVQFEVEGIKVYRDGKYYTSYQKFNNYTTLFNAQTLPGQSGNTFGDLPFHFVAKLDNISNERETSIVVDSDGAATYNIKTNNKEPDTNNGIVSVD